MNRPLGISVALIALLLAALAVFVLPDLNAVRSDNEGVEPTLDAQDRADEAGAFVFVSGLRKADTVLATGGARVEHGDTLAVVIDDPHRLLREDLLALRDGELSPTEALATYEQVGRVVPDGDSFPLFLAELQAESVKKSRLPRPKSRGATVDRTMLTAEVMGAEDATKELRERLRFMASASSADAKQQVAALERAIEEKEAFVASARKAMRPVPRPKHRSWHLDGARLTDEQQTRVERYAASIAPDTLYVLAPETGTFRVHDAQRPNRIELDGPRRKSRETTEKPHYAAVETRGGYELRPSKQPELWSTAQRHDTIAGAGERSLIVVPE